MAGLHHHCPLTHCLQFILIIAILPGGYSVHLRGAGAAFPEEVYRSWMSSYLVIRRKYIDLRMTYDTVGSGGGKSRIQQPLPDLDIEYAGSDSILTDSEYLTYPMLKMLPSVAGAVVLTYNLPGISNLVLSRHHIVGIYNGTYTNWNDSSIRELNPDISLPNQRIRVFARSDKSGQTEIFTKALSSFSPEWKSQYGYFIDGVDSNDNPLHWNSSVVELYGNTYRGLLGLVLTFKYSVAYLLASQATDASIHYATIVNKAGFPVLPFAENIQKAMDEKADEFTSRLTVDLVDSDGEAAYPISAFTYFIVRLDNLQEKSDCDTAVALYRYIKWFSTSSEASRITSEQNRVPVSSSVSAKIQTDVLDLMKCGGQLVSVLAADQEHAELLSTQVWRLPVYILTPLISLLILGLVALLVRQQMKLNREMRKKTYLIPENKIKVISGYGNQYSSSQASLFGKSRAGATDVTSTKSVSSSRDTSRTMMTKLAYNNQEVFLRRINVHHPDVLNVESRRKLLLFRDKLNHINVLTFYGLAYLDKKCYLVSSACQKGILHDVLQNNRYNLDINFKYSISGDIASGMEYLHSLDVVHAHLSSTVCYIDSRWTVKIADWEYLQLLTTQRYQYQTLHKFISADYEFDDDFDDDNIQARRLYWTDPQLLREPNLKPMKSADVYSFSVILVEIFTRQDPYDELSDEAEPKEIIERVKLKDIRPKIPEELSKSLQLLISLCWDSSAAKRPSFTDILRRLKKIKPSKKSVLDCMMVAVEKYAGQLEEIVEERTKELEISMKKTENLLYQMLPKSVAEKLAQGDTVLPESVESVTIFFSDIVGFTALSSMSSPLEVVRLLNDLFTTWDHTIDNYQVYKIESIGDAYMVISGLPDRTDQHAVQIANMAIDFAVVSASFKIHHLPKERLNLRVGIHSGPVAGGIIGTKMPRYTVFGDAVNIASRMESTSVTNKIQCSHSTFTQLTADNQFLLQPRGEISVKGKGSMKTYWLNGRTDNSVQMPPEFLRQIPE